MSFFLKEQPKEETLRAQAERYPELDVSAIQACIRLARVGSDLLASFDANLARHGLSQGRFILMLMLLRHPEGLRPAELAERAGVTRATITGLLSGLEKEGLVLRREHEVDGRMSVVHLSAKGHQRLEGMLPNHYRRIAALMGDLTAEERTQLMHLLDKVAGGFPKLRDP